MDAGRAGVAGPGPGADDALAVQGGAQPLVADVVLHHLGDGRLEDDVDGLGVAAEELLDLGPVGGVADPGVAPTVAQRAADAVEQGLVGLVALHVARRELGHGGGAAIGVVPQGDRGAVLERAPQVGVHELDPVPAVAQPELVDHERVQQADRVGARAHEPAGSGKGCSSVQAPPEPVRAARGRARCVRPGRDRPPRSARCGRRRPPRRPSAAPPAPRSGRAVRPARTPHACARPAMLAGRRRVSGAVGGVAPSRRGAAWSRMVDGTSDSSVTRARRVPRRRSARAPNTSASSAAPAWSGAGKPEDLAQGHVRLPRPQQRRQARRARSPSACSRRMARSRSRWSAS